MRIGKLKVAAGLARRWLAIAATPTPSRGPVAVSYGHAQVPGPREQAHGGMVKFQRMQRRYPHRPTGFNVLYLGSSSLPPDWRQQLWLARRKGAKIVWNQDGVGYPGWHGPGWEAVNEPLAHALRLADHVFYQSAFCKVGGDRFLGPPRAGWEILHNAVDTHSFVPGPPERRPLTLLLGGNQYQRYRLESALRAHALVVCERPDARLIVTGRLSWAGDGSERDDTTRLLAELGLGDRVELAGTYTQEEAPALLRRADILLHTKYNDPCPGIVLEAMACGLPIVYSSSGGVPELVGEAGRGVPAPLDWEHDHPPAPEDLARAVLDVAERLPELRAAARARAVEHFDLAPWLERHRIVFEELVQ